MKIYRNFKLYDPEVNDEILPAINQGALFICDEEGNDWYQLQKTMPNSAWKVRLDNIDSVRGFDKDASGLFPEGCSILVISNIPDDLDTSGAWWWDGKAISYRQPTQDQQIAEAEKKKSQLLSEAASAIAPLQDASDLGIATDEETQLLLAWKKYRVMLNRVDTSMAPGIEWPAPPVVS